MRREQNIFDENYHAEVSIDSHSVLTRRAESADDQAKKGEDMRQAEKARLKLMVRSFASNAVRGIQCEIVDLDTGRVEAAQYNIDRSLRMFTLTPSNPVGSAMESIFSIARITDVFKDEDVSAFSDGAPLGFVKLSEASRKRLVVLRHTVDQDRICLVGFLEPDSVSRETFITCMNILRLYAEANISA